MGSLGGWPRGGGRGQPQGSGSPTPAQPSLLLSYVLGMLESHTRSVLTKSTIKA